MKRNKKKWFLLKHIREENIDKGNVPYPEEPDEQSVKTAGRPDDSLSCGFSERRIPCNRPSLNRCRKLFQAN